MPSLLTRAYPGMIVRLAWCWGIGGCPVSMVVADNSQALEIVAGASRLQRRTANPYLSTLTVLFLPDGDDFLESVDRVSAGFERLCTVRAGDGDDHGILADLQSTNSVLDRHG